MSSDKSVVGGEVSYHDESIGEDLESPHAEMTSIHSGLSPTAERRDDGEEIVAVGSEGASVQSAVRINVYENIPFAGGDGDYSILSVLFGAHSIGEGIFGYLTMIDSNKVRVQCVECRQAVMDFPWMDAKSHIKGSVKAWRAAFPVARAINVSKRNDIVDADFVHIRGDARARLHTVNMRNCGSVTDAAFLHLRGIHTLDMSNDWEYNMGYEKITDAAFVHLRGIHSLDMSDCSQITITDAAFVHLRGIHTLNMRFCRQDTITDATFVHLRGIHTLDMSYCYQDTITDAAFIHLRGIHTLDMSYCDQDTITDAAFVHLRGIHSLDMSFCNQDTITDAAFINLRGIHSLDMSYCDQDTITDAAFVHLRGIHTLDMSFCNQDTITGSTFTHLRGIHDLNAEDCSDAVQAAAATLLALPAL
jgi:hypothetical protein